MKKNVLIVLLFISVFFMINCENSTSRKDGNFVGTWNIKSRKSYITITTNSDQTGFNTFHEGIGCIEVTGDINKTLKYLKNNSEQIVIGETVKEESMTLKIVGTSVILSQENKDNPLQSIHYENDNCEYTFDTETYEITINPTTLYKLNINTSQIDSNSMVQISGTLQNSTIECEANVPKYASDEIVYTYDNRTYTFNEDSTYSISDESEIESGLWEKKNGQLFFKIIKNDLVIEFASKYKFDGDKLTLNYVPGYDSENHQAIITSYEQELRLESGSLLKIAHPTVMELSAK